jgi:hypothetical protein
MKLRQASDARTKYQTVLQTDKHHVIFGEGDERA